MTPSRLITAIHQERRQLYVYTVPACERWGLLSLIGRSAPWLCVLATDARGAVERAIVISTARIPSYFPDRVSAEVAAKRAAMWLQFRREESEVTASASWAALLALPQAGLPHGTKR